MSIRLQPDELRRLERFTGLQLVRAWRWGEVSIEFVTTDHRHGWWDRQKREWRFDEDPKHYQSCFETFPEM